MMNTRPDAARGMPTAVPAPNSKLSDAQLQRVGWAWRNFLTLDERKAILRIVEVAERSKRCAESGYRQRS